MDNLMRYESFFSRIFKKKKSIFVPDYDGSILGDVKLSKDFYVSVNDILTEISDKIDCKISSTSVNLDRSGQVVPHHKSKKTINLLVIDMLGKGGDDFHSTELFYIFHHLESYLKKECDLSIFEICVVKTYDNSTYEPYSRPVRDSVVVKSLEEYDRIDQQVYEVTIKFKY